MMPSSIKPYTQDGQLQHVLIIDDHPPLRYALAQIVKAMGWELAGETGSLKKALELAQTTPWTLGIVDIHLEDGSGLDLLSMLRAQGFEQPLLVFSAAPDEERTIKALKLGASGYLSKIHEKDEFEVALRRIASGRRYVNPNYAETLIEALANGGLEAMSLEHSTQENLDPGITAIRRSYEELSDKEKLVLQAMGESKSAPEIAEFAGLSLSSVPAYRSKVLKKLGLKKSTEIIRVAIRLGLVTP